MDSKPLQKVLSDLIDLSQKIAVHESESTNDSVINLRTYLNLRKYDCSHLQDDLTRLGLSSLGRSQAHVEATFNAAITLLAMALGDEQSQMSKPRLSYDKAHRIMQHNRRIFSKSNDKTKIMITVPSNYNESEGWFGNLSNVGVDLFRINTAHDSPKVWESMANGIMEERKRINKDLKIYVDLAGPKIRTAEIGLESPELAIGAKKHNREFYLVPKNSQTVHSDDNLPIVYAETDFYQKLHAKMRLQIVGADNKRYKAKVIEYSESKAKVALKEKVKINENSKIIADEEDQYAVSPLEFLKIPNETRIFYGDKVLIRTEEIVERKEEYAEKYDAIVRCTLSEAGSLVKTGDHVFLDDGKIELIIESVEGSDIVCSVLTQKKNGVTIKSEKGINFPQSDIAVRALSDHDISLLPDVCRYADIIGISFAQTREDIEQVIAELDRHGKKGEIGIVAKIETPKGVNNLPDILEALIEYGHSGVMIARGDLAIEIGYENLAYMQEEILDLCLAAHMPVILATQVLENKMKTNIPSRAEITDAAFAHKAECVMLNKGEYAIETIKILTSIFHQMDRVFRKNKLLLNPAFQWK